MNQDVLGKLEKSAFMWTWTWSVFNSQSQTILYSLASYLLLNVGERLRDDKLCRMEQFPKSVEHFHLLTVWKENINCVKF